MSDDPNELVKIGMEVALKPVTDIAENVIGIAGGDWLSEKRARNRARLKAQTAEILKERGVEEPAEPSPSVAIPLLASAQEEDRDELVRLWAALLAMAMDPKRRNSYRREYLTIIQRLEPLDAAGLRILAQDVPVKPTRIDFMASMLQVSDDEAGLIMLNLRKVGVVTNTNASTSTDPGITALGRAFLAAVK